jgi:dienelactone hydrolase
MSCPACFAGHINDATPTGRIEKLHGRETYIAEPKSGNTKGIIVIIPDAFGLQFVNNQLLADHYAARGDYKVYLPDFMDGALELYTIG